MVTIVDYWGKEREFDPAQYAKEEYRYPNGVILKVTSPVVVGTCIPYSLSEQ